MPSVSVYDQTMNLQARKNDPTTPKLPAAVKAVRSHQIPFSLKKT